MKPEETARLLMTAASRLDLASRLVVVEGHGETVDKLICEGIGLATFAKEMWPETPEAVEKIEPDREAIDSLRRKADEAGKAYESARKTAQQASWTRHVHPGDFEAAYVASIHAHGDFVRATQALQAFEEARITK